MRALTRTPASVRCTLSFLLALLLPLSLAAPASAHQPVRLSNSAADPLTSPFVLDGTVSYAIYADFAGKKVKGQERHLRFNHQRGDRLELQYLIPDTKRMRTMNTRNLPKVTLTDPSGKSEQITFTERTRFSKPYLPQDYFYLSRLSKSAEAGTYTITIEAVRASSVLVAIGYQEIPGDVLEFGKGARLCPVPIDESDAIEKSVADQLVGMKEESAKLCAESNSWGYRVGERDGEFFALTRDYRIDRITVSITNGIITAVQVG